MPRHDYFENDDAYDEIVTFPPDAFMTEMARATQSMYYPEFLPDATRPRGLAGSSPVGRGLPVSESVGTLRYGRLAEVLLYTVRRTMTLAGPSAVFLDGEVEGWLTRRMATGEVTHVVNAPSNPPGWTAGKWGEWYPDVLREDGTLTTNSAKPYWQSGWLKQHDRLLSAMSRMRGIPLSMSGDLHAIAIGRILRSGSLDLSANPVVTALTGPVGTRAGGWPSGILIRDWSDGSGHCPLEEHHMLQHVTFTYGFNLKKAKQFVADITAEQMCQQPHGLVNHPAWSLGHLCGTSVLILKTLGHDASLPPAWGDVFKTGGIPSGDPSVFPSKEELLATLESLHGRVSEAFANADAATLAAPTPSEAARKTFPTVGDIVVFLMTSHEMDHLGQLAAWRRAMGLGAPR